MGSAPVASGNAFDNLTFTLSNGGATSGTPGSTTGWGFTLTNTLNYVVIESSAFGITQNGGDGSYTDIIGSEFVVVGSGSSPIVQAFGESGPTGVGRFAISPSAPIGDVVLGTIVLTTDIFSVLLSRRVRG